MDPINILIWIAIGAIAGILGKILMPGSAGEPGGWILTILLGIGGAFLGGFLAGKLLGMSTGGFDIKTIIVATIGSMLIIFIYRMIMKMR